MTAGQLVAFLELYLRFVKRGFRVPQLINSVQAGGVAYRRLKPLLAPPLSVDGEPLRASFTPGYVAGLQRQVSSTPGGPAPPYSPAHGDEGEIESPGSRPSEGSPDLEQRGSSLPRVTFRYSGRRTGPSLSDLTLSIPAGALVGVTGAVGSGKSALAKALVGLYPLEQGQILVDGVPLDAIGAEERAALIGYLPQDPWLFSGTVRENIVFGAPALDRPVALTIW